MSDVSTTTARWISPRKSKVLVELIRLEYGVDVSELFTKVMDYKSYDTLLAYKRLFPNKFCRKGIHEMTPENTIRVMNKERRRLYSLCKKCRQDAERRKARHKSGVGPRIPDYCDKCGRPIEPYVRITKPRTTCERCVGYRGRSHKDTLATTRMPLDFP